MKLRVKINGNNLIIFPTFSAQDLGAPNWSSDVHLRIMSGGASAKILADGRMYCMGNCIFSVAGAGSGAYARQSLSTIDMTTNPKITVSLQISNSTAGNSAILEDITIFKGTAPLYTQ